MALDFEKIKEKAYSNKKTIFILFLLFLLAFAIRAHLMRFDLMFAFDSYFHARIASYYAQGQFLTLDPMAYYYLDILPPLKSSFFWVFNAILYNILTLGNGLTGFSKDSWILFVKFAPAFFGALISVAMYFLGKELFNKKTGYAMAFFAAVVPSFVYRTMAGFFEEDALGFLWLVLGFVFFAKAVKEGNLSKKSIINALFAIIFFSFMAWTWDMFLLIPLVLVSYFGTTIILMWLKKEGTKNIIGFTKTFLVIFILFSVFATALTGPTWINSTVNYVTKYIPINMENTERVQGGGNEDCVLCKTVGEENTGKQFFGEKYSLLLLFPILALLFIPLDLLLVVLIKMKFIENKKENHTILMTFFTAIIIAIVQTAAITVILGLDPTMTALLYSVTFLLALVVAAVKINSFPIVFDEKNNKMHNLSLVIFFWTWITLFMALSKLKFTYTFGLPVAASAGVVFFESFELMKKTTGIEKKFIALLMGLMLLGGVGAGIWFVHTKYPQIENPTGWKEGLYWLKDNTPKDAKIFNWWDEGHWISFIGERAVIEDNRNHDFDADADVAKFILSESEEEAKKITDKYDSDYLVFGSDLVTKQGSLQFYAYNTMNSADPRIKQTFGMEFPCRQQIDSLTGKTSYQCGGNNLSQEQMNGVSTTYLTSPNTFLNERTPAFIYKAKNNSAIYILNPVANETFIAKLWFNDPAIENYEEVFWDRQLKIFKVIK
ncbi:MAG: STT3 domain-containing protein [Candidatus Diapherotrites archaeon]